MAYRTETSRGPRSPSSGCAESTFGVVHGGLEYARERAQGHAEGAERALDVLPASAAREALRASIPYVLERRS